MVVAIIIKFSLLRISRLILHYIRTNAETASIQPETVLLLDIISQENPLEGSISVVKRSQWK